MTAKTAYQTIRILVVDDDRDDYILTEDYLLDSTYANFETDWASSYQNGWDRIVEGTHDVYLIDFQLGAKTGLELLEEAINAGIHKPFILLTGQGDRKIDMLAMEKGATDFIVKGRFDAQTLERSVLYAVRHAQMVNELRLSENRYRAVIESQSEMICRYLPNTNLTFVNEAFCRGFGKTVDELIGTSFLMILPPESHEPVLEHIEEAVTHGIASNFEYPINKPNVKTGWTQWTTQCIYGIDEQLLELQSVGVDITDRKNAEIVLQVAYEHERELGELKSRFISMASHEFRTPLTTILSTASFLEMAMGQISPEKNLYKLGKIQQAAHDMTGLLNDVLTFGKADANRLEFEPHNLNLATFCLELVEDIKAAYSNKRMIHFTDNTHHADFNADEKLLRQILTNLLTNAIKYSQDGQPIEFSIHTDASNIVFTVRDFGIGIPEEDLPHLFEPFHRAKNVRDIKGTGLGLAITKKAVEMHNGTITYDTKQNEGTTFTVILPIELEVELQ